MNYFMQINGDPNLRVEVKHFEVLDETRVEIKDFAEFPLDTFKEPTKVSKMELVDENGEVWALRRFPEVFAPLVGPSIQLSVRWVLTITQDHRGAVIGRRK